MPLYNRLKEHRARLGMNQQALGRLNTVFGFGLLPVFVVLAVEVVMQASYILECMRLSKAPGGPPWRC